MKLNIFKNHWPIILIIFAAAMIRVFALLHVGDFTWDELFNFVFSQKHWGDSIRIWQFETNPPLHLFLLKLWWAIAPTTELWARLPSLLFGLLSIWLIYLLGKKIFSSSVGILAALITAIAAPHIYASVLARIYSILFFLTTLSLWYFYQIFVEEKRDRKIIIGYIITQIFLLFSHLTAVEVLIGQFFALIILCAPRQKYRQWIKLNLLPILLWGAWEIPSLITKFSNPQIGQAWFLNLSSGGSALVNISQIIFGLPWDIANLASVIIFSLIIILMIGKNIYYHRNISPSLKFICAYLGATFGIAIAFNLWNYKFFIITMPALFIVLAYLTMQTKKWLAIILIALLLFWQTANTVNWLKHLPIAHWDNLDKLVAQIYHPNKKQLIVVAYFVDKLAFDHYYRGPMSPISFLPFSPEKFEEEILRNNYNYAGYTFEPKIAQQWYNANHLEQQEEILIFDWDILNTHLNTTFEKNGWQLKNAYPVNIPIKHTIYYYVKNHGNKK